MSDNTEMLGTTGKTALVHKMDAEGGLVIDAITGQVLPGQHDRPEWAAGLACALLAERHGFYTQRLGTKYADAHKMPEAYAFQDLGWIAVDEEGAEVELQADDEYRMSVIAEVFGANREEGTLGTVLAEHEIALDTNRTADEYKALTEDQSTGFGATKTGTEG